MDAELLLKTMADATRLRVLRVLSAYELSVNELVEVLEQPQSTISRHLKPLREAGLVRDRRMGTAVFYSIAPIAGMGLETLSQQEGDSASDSEPINGNGRAGLRNTLLQWVVDQGPDAGLRERIETVIRRRRADSDAFFDNLGGRWDQLRLEAFGDVFYREALNALLPAEWVVADIGTGTGYLLPALAGQFRRVIAVEPAAAMIEAAKSRPELQRAEHVDFRVGSLDDLPITDNELDLAIASLVLHHVPESAGAIREIRRCLKPTGQVLIIEQEAHADADFHERMGDRWQGFESTQVIRWLKEAGFADIRNQKLTTARPTGRYNGFAPALYAVIARCSAGQTETIAQDEVLL